MRLKIVLEPVKNKYLLPLNYQYALSAIVYKIFASGSESVAAWLHEKGFSDGGGKNMKLFNFSNLEFENYRIMQDHIVANGKCSFIFSTPVHTELADTFVQGIMNFQNFKIGNYKYSTEFSVRSIEIEKVPQFTNSHIFKTLTPITLSTIIQMNDEKKIYYLRPEDNGFMDAIKNNLLKKYKLLINTEYAKDLRIEFINNNFKSKLVHIKEGQNGETKVKAFHMDLRINADIEMMKVIYYCGIGEKGSMGFGMVREIR